MTYRVIFKSTKVIEADISKIWKKDLNVIFSKIKWLKTLGINQSQVKRLKNYKIASFRLRTGNYRLLFDFDVQKNEITIFRILHRSKLY